MVMLVHQRLVPKAAVSHDQPGTHAIAHSAAATNSIMLSTVKIEGDTFSFLSWRFPSLAQIAKVGEYRHNHFPAIIMGRK